MEATNKMILINLSKFHGSRVIEDYDEDGNTERGIFIPLDRNGLFEDKHKCVIIYAFANLKRRNDKNVYRVVQSVARSVYEKLLNLGYGRTLLGYMCDMDRKYTRENAPFSAQRIVKTKTKK